MALSQRLSSVNDGAPWTDRITTNNYPQAIQIIDWYHADERLWKVSKAAFGEGTLQAQQWVEKQAELLWHGHTREVVSALYALEWKRITCLDDVRQSPAYFESRQSKMDYAHFRQQGYPIGSGTVESGVNTVVHHRMKRQGHGWKRKKRSSHVSGIERIP